ncbi:glyoxalase [Chitinophagaceae bacterium IBVUCB1]|nr:glyoxalase [Chitinophagaceae bacterium IBVUCB1]
MASISIKKLHHVTICIPTGFEAEARGFYTGLLGLQEIEKPKSIPGIWYRVGESELHLGIEPEMYPTKRFPAFEVDSLDSVRNLLQEKGIGIKEEAPIPGYKRISFLDPWKNKLELLQRM